MLAYGKDRRPRSLPDKAEAPVKLRREPRGRTSGLLDTVQISSDNGNISETTTSKGASASYTQTPDARYCRHPRCRHAGTTPTLYFDRRWTVPPDVAQCYRSVAR